MSKQTLFKALGVYKLTVLINSFIHKNYGKDSIHCGRVFKAISNFCRCANNEAKLYGISRAFSYECISGMQILFLLAKRKRK